MRYIKIMDANTVKLMMLKDTVVTFKKLTENIPILLCGTIIIFSS